jgi:hypothetical protein
LVSPSAAAGYIADHQPEQREIPETCGNVSVHKRALEALKPKARVARAVVVFDPWHAPVPKISVRHGALLNERPEQS